MAREGESEALRCQEKQVLGEELKIQEAALDRKLPGGTFLGFQLLPVPRKLQENWDETLQQCTCRDHAAVERPPMRHHLNGNLRFHKIFGTGFNHVSTMSLAIRVFL